MGVFIDKYKKFFPLIILLVFCFSVFFAFCGSYPLIDVDETRYVRIAQEMFEGNNFLTPIINGELFLEKPPLFFWLEDLSFAVFGVINEFSARIPMAVVATIGVFAVFLFGKKLVSEKFGLIAALILGCNVIYIVLSHIAILDLLLSVTMMISAYCGILTLYTKGKENWIYWLCFYLFCGLSVLSKGIPGLVIPFAIVFFVYLFSKRFKELFDYKKIAIGILLLMLVVLPWHIAMYKEHGTLFVNEYIIKHHIARFVNSAGINRKEPPYFFIPVILIGFIPFIFTLITVSCSEVKKWFSNLKNGFKYNIFNYFAPEVGIKKQFLNINILSAVLIFLFFSASSTKLPTYILPIVFPLAYVAAYIFDENFENGKFDFPIKISHIILLSIFSVATFGAVIAVVFIKNDVINDLKSILLTSIVLLVSYSVFGFIKLSKSKKNFFYSTVVFMIILTNMLNLQIFNYVVSNGEIDLINYSKFAKEKQLPLATFGFGARYSAIYYYENHVDIQIEPEYNWLKEKLDSGYFVILKNKNMIDMPSDVKSTFSVVETGKKYSIVRKNDDEKFILLPKIKD